MTVVGVSGGRQGGVGWGGVGGRAYGIASAEFLLCSDHRSASLGGVESALASYDGFSCCSSRSTGLAPDLRDGIPVIHLG
jgi:hypothetical protein